MRDRIRQGIAAGAVKAVARGTEFTFALEASSWSITLAVRDGSIYEVFDAPPGFVLRACDLVWEGLLADAPAAGAHSVVYLVRTRVIELIGSDLEYDRHVQVVRALIDAVRGESSAVGQGRALAARGEYRRVKSALGTSDIYVERAGSGPVLLAFATAGSDTSQWHGIMTHSDLTDRYELVTVDLPWHGKSSPAWGMPVGSYTLTPDSYTDFIVAVADAVGADSPILLGASMAGAAVVHAVATHPERFAGAVACQAGPSVMARSHEHLRGTRVNPMTFIPEWTYGLMNPTSPEAFKRRVWWGYSSGGYGTYAADIDSYLQWNLDEVQHGLTARSPHIAVLSGSFDTSVPPQHSAELAARIPNASFVEMPELGHFPHAENPPLFAKYLESALRRVMASRNHE